MRAVVLQKPGDLAPARLAKPGRPAPDTALVRVRRIGVCGTDFHAYHGRQPFFSYPRILGHELAVEIAEIGANEAGLRAGDLCAVEPYLNCQGCIACRSGKPNCCVDLSVLGVHEDGGMREYLHVPARKLHPSSQLALDQLALVETLAIGAHAVSRAKVEAGEWAMVIGAGPIGLSVTQFARLAGARVIVSDVSEERLARCREHTGVGHAVKADDAPGVVRELTEGGMPTVVFDATGNAGSMMSAFKLAAHGGRLVFVGLFQGDVTFSDPDLHKRELTLLASRNSLAQDFRRIIALAESGEVDTRRWVTHRAGLDAVPSEFPAWTRPASGVLKAMIELE